MEARATGDLTPRTLGRRPVLDGLRGVAVTLVVLMHTRILPGGFVGVDLFFALSGFLITTLLYEEWERSGTIGLRRFYERRARRLLPALLLVVLLAALTDALVYPLTGWPLPEKTLATFLFMNNWVAALGHSQALGGLNPTWSLGQEEQFYLVWPVLLACMLRRRLGPRAVAAILMVTIMALIYVSADVTSQATPSAVYYSPADRSAELLLGCLASLMWRHRLIPSPVALLGRISEVSGWVAGRLARPARLLLCLVLIYLFWHVIAHVTTHTRRLRMRTDYMDSCLIGVLLIINLLALPTSLLTRGIGWWPLRQLGRISYALYLLHLPIYNLLRHWYPAASVDQIAVATFALAVPAAALSWRLFESRLLLTQPAQQRRAGVRPTWTGGIAGTRAAGPSRKRSPAPGVAR